MTATEIKRLRSRWSDADVLKINKLLTSGQILADEMGRSGGWLSYLGLSSSSGNRYRLLADTRSKVNSNSDQGPTRSAVRAHGFSNPICCQKIPGACPRCPQSGSEICGTQAYIYIGFVTISLRHPLFAECPEWTGVTGVRAERRNDRSVCRPHTTQGTSRNGWCDS